MPMKRGVVVALGAIGALSLAVGGAIVWVGSKNIGSILPPPEQCEATVNGQTVVLDPEQAESAAIIAGVAVRRGLRERAGARDVAPADVEPIALDVPARYLRHELPPYGLRG
jgi:hypothetical protein